MTEFAVENCVRGPLERFAEHLAELEPEELGGTIRSTEVLPERSARSGEFELPETLTGILKRRRITDLYSHQAEALSAWRAGNDVLLATGTASGKSLVYNLAVAQRALEDRDARALFLFPLKALEHDQLGSLREDLSAMRLLDPPSAEIYDGDTSPYRRKKIRENPPTVLLSTPDMLHAGILPRHDSWKEFLSKLELIVVDEVHTYRGVIGAHVAQVLRRLIRIANSYGVHPQIVACSATIGNPSEFITELTGRKPVVISRDGSPQAQKRIVFVEPEASAYTAAARLFRRCVREGLRTIAFTQARRITELMHMWIVEAEPQLRSRISSYRSGFLPEERREIERRLFDGDLAGVISTSALEMGIDVGGLDVCILVGYPGSILATRQRAGRVGRGRESLVFLVPGADALDRFFLKHPHALIERPCEDAVVDPGNLEILAGHLPCAAAEIPLRHDEAWLEQRGVAEALATAHSRGSLLESAQGGESFAARRNPSREISLRSVGESFTIKKPGSAGKRVVGTIGSSRAYSECHPGAIYLHHAQSFAVKELDLEKREVSVEGPLKVDHYTRALGEKDTEILETTRSRPLGNALLKLGRLKITSKVTHYEKRRVFGQDLLGRHPLELPSTSFETEGLWIELAPEIENIIKSEGGHFMGGIHGLEHAALALFPLFALCDRFDMAGISIPRHAQVRGPAVFMYDSHPGGIGISRSVFAKIEELLELTLKLVSECECEEGCPSCIHSPRCGAGNRPLDKQAVIRTLELVLSQEPLQSGTAECAEEQPFDNLAPAVHTDQPKAPVLFDVETQRSAAEVGGWHNTHLMRVALAVLYDSGTGEFETFFEDRVGELVERLFEAPAVVGFNIRRFDYGVLSAYSARDLAKLPTFDLLEDVHKRLGYRLSLGHLGEITLGHGKSADGLQSLEWFKNGELDKIEKYCRADVELMRDLMDFSEREGHVLFQRKRDKQIVRLPVDWSIDTVMETVAN
ncbi:MAG: DEAD/DEAH box helicase [bacterium]|nr:DEAD/DEAH box helicase [bacterium]